MRQEQACCASLTFEMHEEPDAVTLTIKAPEEARATVEALFEAFLPAEGQTVENQLRPLKDAAGRLGWSIVLIYRHEVIRGTRDRDKRSGAGLLQSVVSSSRLVARNPFARIHVSVVGGCAFTICSEISIADRR